MKRVNGKNGRLRIRIGGAFEKVMAQVRENIRRASCPYGSCRAECRMKKGNDCLMAKQFAKENHRAPRRNIPVAKSPLKRRVFTPYEALRPQDDTEGFLRRVERRGSVADAEMAALD